MNARTLCFEAQKTNGQPQAASVDAAYSAAFPVRQRGFEGDFVVGFTRRLNGF
jgi:hypothetical protein